MLRMQQLMCCVPQRMQGVALEGEALKTSCGETSPCAPARVNCHAVQEADEGHAGVASQ